MDIEHKIAQLKSWLADPHEARGKKDILARRIYALEHDVACSRPFDNYHEVLYLLWKDIAPS